MHFLHTPQKREVSISYAPTLFRRRIFDGVTYAVVMAASQLSWLLPAAHSSCASSAGAAQTSAVCWACWVAFSHMFCHLAAKLCIFVVRFSSNRWRCLYFSPPLPSTGIASIIANVNNQAFAVIVAWKLWKPPENYCNWIIVSGVDSNSQVAAPDGPSNEISSADLRTDSHYA